MCYNVNMGKKRRSYPKSANKNIRLYFDPKDETLQDFGTKDLDGIKIKIKTIINPFKPDLQIKRIKDNDRNDN